MPSFSAESLAQLATCDQRLQTLAAEVIKIFDFTVLEGHRGQAAQEAAYARGATQLHWPHGNHNATPSRAMDVAPYPIDWSDKEAARQRFCYLAGFMMCTAIRLGIPLRWGGDWNGNRDTRDEHFRDLPHFELLQP